MSRPDNREAWSRFWADGGAGPESGCLPKALETMDEAQRELWQSFAGELRRGAHVLDLATGDGLVLGKMRAIRGDLKLTGVDSSPVLPPARKGLRLRAGVAMESLPFRDASFDAVTSQFGVEYGEARRVAEEVGRVLRPGGVLQFVIHYRDGPILAHNLPLRAAMRWAAQESGYVEKARAFVRARKVARLPTPPHFRTAPGEARRRFPGQPGAEEFLAAIFQTLELSRNARIGEALEVLQTLEERALNQIARVDALEGAARDRAGLTALMEDFEAAGLSLSSPGEVRERGVETPFAWLVRGRRPAEQERPAITPRGDNRPA